MSSKKQVIAGGVKIGGGAPVSVQSMLNTPAEDTEASVRQAVELERAGCSTAGAAALRPAPPPDERGTAPILPPDVRFAQR